MPSDVLPRPELLAPAGNRECLRAAVENGADAVYFGLNCGFNARARATNIESAELPEIMAFLHHRGVKGFVTLNTLAFSDELPELELLVRQIALADVDAVLVQDLGVVRLVRAICPELAIHASTQMTLTSAECIQVAEEMGIERVVLPRELSIPEIARLRKSTNVELEAFVHGALCVAYSGQCLTSESLGGRSANRGQCAQACRLPYDLICDGDDVDLGPQKYLLSPQDLAAYELTPDLIAAGVCSFKIEGRLKTPEYVANITHHYRTAIDAAIGGKPVQFTRDEVREMELSFSRGFSPGWLKGDDHKMLVPALSSSKRGVLLGEVIRTQSSRVEIRLTGPVARGDGVVFAGDRTANAEQGGRVYMVLAGGRPVESASGGIVELEFQRDALDLSKLEPGQKLWKTDDPQLTARLRKTFTGPDPLRKRPVFLRVQAIAGKPMVIEATLAGSGGIQSVHAQVESAEPLPLATRHIIRHDFLQEQLSRLGNTVYELAQLDAEIVGGPMVPLSVLSKLRHDLVGQLDRLTQRPRLRQLADPSALSELRSAVQLTANDTAGVGLHEPRLQVLCRTLAQLTAVARDAELNRRAMNDGSVVYADFQDIREYRDAVRIAHDANLTIFLATPRIQKPDELGLFHAIGKHGADGILVRNLAGLRFYTQRGIPVVADYSLNATNELTAEYLQQQGAGRITASYDLNRDQLLNLVSAVPPRWLEVVVHQHMPMFHMEHCVFCAVLSPGTNKTNCGRPCDSHAVQLRDRVGSEHPLHADVGCRNTLFNSVPQSAAEVVPSLIECGVRDFRLEFLSEIPSEIPRTLKLYRELLAGQIRAEAVWRQLNASNRVGVTRGTLEERRNPLAIL
ncbi:MAG: U32 family peptidase [Planctomycetes bacterium]|nr:U32 family peptidase [Planctomycetota bacterium]